MTPGNVRDKVNVGNVVGTLKPFSKIQSKYNSAYNGQTISFLGNYVGVILHLYGAQTVGATDYDSRVIFTDEDSASVLITANRVSGSLSTTRVGNTIKVSRTERVERDGEILGRTHASVTVLYMQE